MRPYVRLTKVLIRYRLRVSLSVYSESTTGVDSAYIFPILALHTLSSLPPPPPVLRHFLFHHTFSVSQSIWHTQHTLKVGGGCYIAWGVEKNIPSFFIRIFLVRIDPAQCANIPLSQEGIFPVQSFSFFASLNRKLGWWYLKVLLYRRTPLILPHQKTAAWTWCSCSALGGGDDEEHIHTVHT